MSTHPARRGWSYAEFARLPDDGNRYEIIDGELFATPSPHPVTLALSDFIRGYV